jgi:hypothetical protein
MGYIFKRHSREGGNPERPRGVNKVFFQRPESLLDGPVTPDHDEASGSQGEMPVPVSVKT